MPNSATVPNPSTATEDYDSSFDQYPVAQQSVAPTQAAPDNVVPFQGSPPPSSLISAPVAQPAETRAAVASPLAAPAPTAPQPTLEQKAANPLNLPDDVNNRLTQLLQDQTLPQNQPPPVIQQKAAVSDQPKSFLPESQPGATSTSPSFLPESQQTTSTQPAAAPSGGTQSFLPEANQSVDTEAPPEQNYRTQLDTVSSKFEHDSNKILDAYANGEISDIDDATHAAQFAQWKQGDNINNLMHASEQEKMLADWRNAKNMVGGWLGAIPPTAQSLWNIPGQALSTLQTATQTFAPDQAGSDPLKPPTEQAGPIGKLNAIGAEGTPLASSDIVRPSWVANPITDKTLDAESGTAKLTLASGLQQGIAQNMEFAENLASRLVGLTPLVPNAILKVFGGPHLSGAIDPKAQAFLATQGIPIRSGEDPNDMDPAQLRVEALVRRMQTNSVTQRLAGNVGDATQQFLTAWNGGKPLTPEQQSASGFPVQSKKVQDIADTTNNLLSIPEFGGMEGLLEASGIKSVLRDSAATLVQSSADIPKAIAKVTAPKVVDAATEAAGKQAFEKSIRTAITATIGHSIGIPFPLTMAFDPLVGPIAKPIAGVLGLVGKTAGLIPKATSLLAEHIGDALSVAGQDALDGTSLLSTRAAIKQFIGKGALSATETGMEMAPIAALGGNNDQERASLFAGGMALGMLGHVVPDTAGIVRNELGDKLFITDNNYGRNTPAAPPTAYKTDPVLDALHEKAINNNDSTTGQPAFSNSKKNLINNTRASLNGMAEVYVLDPQAYEDQIGKMADRGVISNPLVNSRGIAIDPSPGTNQARILVRSDSFSEAFPHELGHPLYSRLSPEDQDLAFRLYARKNDPNEFTQNYTSKLPGSPPGGVLFDSLPTEAEAAAGKVSPIPGMTQEDMRNEMGAEAISGLVKGGALNDLTRNPGLIHQGRQMLGRMLEHLGMDPVTAASQSVLGLQQSVGASYVLEPLVREAIRRNTGVGEQLPPDLKGKPKDTSTGGSSKDKSGTTSTSGTSGGPTGGGGPKPGPAGPAPVDEALVKSVMAAGFTRAEALAFIAKAKVVPVNAPSTPSQSVPGPSKPSPSTSSGTGNQAPTGPSEGPPPDQTTQKPTETTDETAPLQKVLREDGRLSPAEAQHIVLRSPRPVTGGAPQPALHGKGNIGAFGYAGDASWDHASLRGEGAFKHSSKPGSLIPGYSAALTDEGAALRHVRPGQEFIGEDGKTYRYDDRVPDTANGHKVSSNYVDVYDPSHAPDHGVSAAQIAKNEAYMAQYGIGSNGKRGPIVDGETPKGPLTEQGSQPLSPTAAPTSPVQAPEAPKAPITKESIESAESDARQSTPQGNKSDSAYEAAIRQQVIDEIGAQHAASLAPGDTRVQSRPGGYISGTHFVTDGSDAFHDFLLQGQSPQVMDVLKQAQDAIAAKRDIFATYKSAPQAEAGTPTGAQRQVAQAKSAAADRAKGLADIQQAGKEIAPSWVGVSPGKGGEPNTVLIGGSSADKISSNASQIVHGLGPRSPYSSGPMGSPMAMEDLKGALHNQNNGWKMDGSAKLTPTPGHEADVPQESPGFQPYHMSKAKGDFWNLAAGQGSEAKLSESAKAKKSAAAFEMARANQGFAEGGYTNPLAKQIDLAHPPQPVLDSAGKPKLDKAGKPITETWTQSKLNSPWETLRADNIAEIHDSGGSPHEKIHPGQAEVSEAMKEKGTPKSFPSKSGFLPGEGPKELSTEDRIKKTRHMIANIERKQSSLDLDDPKNSDRWDELQGRIHELEAQAEKLKASAPSKASFMPGDLSPERRERILDEAVANHGVTNNPAESGWLLPSGQFLDMSEGYHGSRETEHDAVQITKDNDEITADLMRKSGAVRISGWSSEKDEPGGGGQTEIGILPLTKAQRAVMMDHFKNHGSGWVSVVDNDGRSLHEKEYPAGTSHTQIMGDAIRGQMARNMSAAKAAYMPGDLVGSDENPQVHTPEFKRWFGKSQATDDYGRPLRLYHGTTHDFDAHSTAEGNAEGDWGKGIYLSNNPEEVSANYAGTGPDLTGRVERRAESLEEYGYDNQDDIRELAAKHNIHIPEGVIRDLPEIAKQIATKELVGEHPSIQPLYASLKNPVHIGGDTPTEWTYKQNERTGKESGDIPKFAEAVRNVFANNDIPGDEEAIGHALEDVYPGEETSAEQVITRFRHSDPVANHYTSDLSPGEIARQVLQEMGHDGIIDNTVDRKFGSQKPYGTPMKGMTPETTHVVAFDPENVKSATGNRGTFSKKSANVNYMPAESAGAEPEDVAKARAAWKSQGTESPYFRKWFGNSKAVDENGKPQVVYHGTNLGFDQFERSYIRKLWMKR